MSAAAPRRLAGQAAAPGIVFGQVIELDDGSDSYDISTAPDISLTTAMAQAIEQLQELIARTTNVDARTILEFQIEFLRDPELIEPIKDQLANGTAPVQAWAMAIDVQIEDFASSEDDYFRHRAADLRDMKERVHAILSGRSLAHLELPDDVIVLADDLAPSRFLATPWRPGQAIVLRGGSPTAHVALLARARNVPMVVGVGPFAVPSGATAILDGSTGTLHLAPDGAQIEEYERRRTQLAGERELNARMASHHAVTASGEKVQVLLNISTLAELETIDPGICDGIGLVRTELLFEHGPPDEDTQFRAYWRIVEWAAGRPVIVRTLDAGGDKPIPGVTVDGESNPFLGVRGVRLSLAKPEVFKTQLRALLRAAIGGSLRVMIPMVTAPAEVIEVRRLLLEARAELLRRNVPFGMPPLGIMVEVPAAALAIDAFDIEFASIGSNDLLQYVMAAARDNRAVSELTDPTHPGFMNLLRTIVERTHARGVSLSLCGDLAAQPAHIPLLLSAGVRALSMPAASVGAVKRTIAQWRPVESGSE